MEIHDRLDDLARHIETARAVPLSASCVVPRHELLDLIEDARAALPDSVREADEILAEREDLIEDATRESEEMLERARVESSQLVGQAQADADRISDDARNDADELLERARIQGRRMIDEQEVLIAAQQEAVTLIENAEVRARALVDDAARQAEQVAATAQEETSRERLQTDEFVDGKLAELEESLATSLSGVRRGRDRIHARRSSFDPLDLRTPASASADPFLYDQIVD